MTEKPHLVVVGLAIFRPDVEFLKEQLDSLQRQKIPYDQIVVGVDDISIDPEVMEILQTLPRATIILGENKGSIRNFERILNKVILNFDAEVIFLCDQDDIWKDDKISRHVELHKSKNLKNVLIYSDLTGINANGKIILDSVTNEEKRLATRLPFFNAILRNDVTGCASSMNFNLAALSLPFPNELEDLGVHHDAWINSLASALEGKFFIQEKLVLYRNHGTNQIGIRFKPFRYKQFKAKISAYRVRHQLAFLTHQRLLQRNETPINKDLGQFLDKSLVFLARNFSKMILNPNRFLYLDFVVGVFLSKIHTFFKIMPLRVTRYSQRILRRRVILQKVAFLFFSKSLRIKVKNYLLDPQPSELHLVQRLSIPHVLQRNTRKKLHLLVPHLPPEPVFGGISTALHLATSLAQNHALSLDIVSTNYEIRNFSNTVDILRRDYNAPSDLMVNDFTKDFVISPGDVCISTAWWTAEYVQKLQSSEIPLTHIYLIQDFEPNFYSWSSNFARAFSTYSKSSIKVFNTNLLREYFVNQNLAMKSDLTLKPLLSTAVNKAKKKVDQTSLIFYYRPSVSRNMSSLTLESIEYFVANRQNEGNLVLTAVGEKIHNFKVAGQQVISYGHLPVHLYQDLLSHQDIGLSLMLSPHPSYPPLDFAASGILTVTNSFENKRQGAIPFLEILDPTAESLGRGLIIAESNIGKYENDQFEMLNSIRDSLGDFEIDKIATQLGDYL
jgi:hypothetical protein